MITKELIDFIKKSKQEGRTEQEIRSLLIPNGWLPSDIEEGLGQVALSTGCACVASFARCI